MPRDSSKIYRFSAVYKITSPVTNIILPAPPPWHTERARQVVVPAQGESPSQGEQGDIEQAERHHEDPVSDPSDLPVRPRASRDSTPDSDAEVDALLQVPTLTRESPEPGPSRLDMGVEEETVDLPIGAVSGRRGRTIRETNKKFWYFTSAGGRIHIPPQIPKDMGIQVGDLYVHRITLVKAQGWRCTAVEPTVAWQSLPTGTSEIGEDGVTRTFVITENGLPGWVTRETLQRKYKDLQKRR